MRADTTQGRTFLASAARTDLSIVEGLRSARRSAGLTVLDADLSPRRIGYHDLADLADRAARTLRAHGVSPGDRVCLLAPTSPNSLITLFGIWRLGAVPVVMPRPRRSGTEAFVEEIRRRVKACSPALLVTTEQNAGLFGERVSVPTIGLSQLSRSTAGTGLAPPPMPSPEGTGLLQFTSGTTAASRAVPVTQAQLIGNIAAVGERAGIGADDVYVSWLPLYHDMGIVSLAGVSAGGADIVMMATETFTQQPSAWMRTVSDYGGTLTAAPNFAYSLAAKVQALRPAAMNLSSLRVAINGAEAIDADALHTAQEVLAGAGFGPTTMCPMYGLAEATLAVSGSGASDPVRILEPATPVGEKLAGEEPRPARRLVSCGSPVPGTELRVLGTDGHPLPAGAVGEVLVRGPGVTPGYWTAGDESPGTGTRNDGWLATGDLGFLDHGELVICGRKKDMVIAGGRNLYPEDYETLAERVPGIRGGNVVAFSLPGQERMVVVAEGRSSAADLEELGARVMRTLHDEAEHAPHEVLLIKPGTLPKTSSGKRQRQAARARYEDGTLEVLHTVR